MGLDHLRRNPVTRAAESRILIRASVVAMVPIFASGLCVAPLAKRDGRGRDRDVSKVPCVEERPHGVFVLRSKQWPKTNRSDG